MTQNTKTIIKFDIPYGLGIPDGQYPIIYKGFDGEITITRITRTHSAPGESGIWSAEGGNVELAFDKWGLLHYSQIQLKINSLIPNEDIHPSELLDFPPRPMVKEIAVEFINRFLQVYRCVTEEFQVTPLSIPELKNFSCEWFDNDRRVGSILAIAGTGLGVVRFRSGTVERTFANKITVIRRINSENEIIPLDQLFLMDAKNSFLTEDYLSAILFSIFALEIAVNNFIRITANEKKIDRKKIEKLIRWTGLEKKIITIIPSFLDNKKVFDEAKKELCVKAVYRRNAIAHEGLRQIKREDADKEIISIIEYIDFLHS